MTQPIIITASSEDLGDGFTVRRALPHPQQRMVGPFIFWDHFGPAVLNHQRRFSVRPHPHIGLATVTYLFDGEITHRDSLGNQRVIRPGEVNLMTAGRGIVHSERCEPEAGIEVPLEGIQLWIALPLSAEEMAPSFQHYAATELPEIVRPGWRMTVIMGELFDSSSPVLTYSPTFYASLHFERLGTISISVPSGHQAAVYVAQGKALVNGESLEVGQLACYNEGGNIDIGVEKAARLLIFGGEPFLEKRHIWWNFVSSSKARIEQAKADWQAGNFPSVPGETEFIPLP